MYSCEGESSLLILTRLLNLSPTAILLFKLESAWKRNKGELSVTMLRFAYGLLPSPP